MPQEIKNKLKKIKTPTSGIAYPSKFNQLQQIQTNYRPVQTQAESFQESISKNIQRLQAANADPTELENNLKASNAQDNKFFKMLDYLTRPGRGSVAFLTSLFGNEKIKMDMGTRSPFEAFSQVLTTGNLRAMELRNQEFTGANFLQSWGGQTLSTEDWSDAANIIGSLLVEVPIDPTNIFIGPVAKGVAKGVKGGLKGASKVSSKFGSKIMKTHPGVAKLFVPKATRLMSEAADLFAKEGIILPTKTLEEFVLASSNKTISSFRAKAKSVGNSLGIFDKKTGAVGKQYSINETIRKKLTQQQLKDANQYDKHVATTMKKIVNRRPDEDSILFETVLKESNIWPDSISVADLKGNVSLQQQYIADFQAIVTDAMQGQTIKTPIWKIAQDLLKGNLDDLGIRGGYRQSQKKVVSGPDSEVIKGLPRMRISEAQKDEIFQGLADATYIPKDKATWPDYIQFRNVSEDALPYYEMTSSNAFAERVAITNNRAQGQLTQSLRDNPNLNRKFIKTLSRDNDLLNYSKQFYGNSADMRELTLYYKGKRYVSKLINGEKGFTKTGWTKIKKDLTKFNPEFANSIDDLMRENIRVYQGTGLSKIPLKRTLSKGKATELLKKQLNGIVSEDLSPMIPQSGLLRRTQSFITHAVGGEKGATLKGWTKLKKELIPVNPDFVKKADKIILDSFKETTLVKGAKTVKAIKAIQPVKKNLLKINYSKGAAIKRVKKPLSEINANPYDGLNKTKRTNLNIKNKQAFDDFTKDLEKNLQQINRNIEVEKGWKDFGNTQYIDIEVGADRAITLRLSSRKSVKGRPNLDYSSPDLDYGNISVEHFREDLQKNYDKIFKDMVNEITDNPTFTSEQSKRALKGEKTLEDLIDDLNEANPKINLIKRTKRFLKKYVDGDAGFTLSKWKKLRDDLIPYDEELPKAIDDLIQGQLVSETVAGKIKPITRIPKGQFTNEAKIGINKLFQQFDNTILEGSPNIIDDLIKKADVLQDIGNPMAFPKNAFFNTKLSEAKNLLRQRSKIAKELGVSDETIEGFSWKRSVTGEFLRDSKGEKIPMDYVPKVRMPKNTLNPEIDEFMLGVDKFGNESNFVKKAIGNRQISLESTQIGRISEINEVYRIRNAHKYIKEGIVNLNQPAAKVAADAKFLASKWDFFITNPAAIAAKAFNTISETFNFVSVVKVAFKQGLITTRENITSRDFLEKNYKVLSPDSAKNLFAKTDEKLALKLSRGEKISRDEFNTLLQEKFSMFVPDELRDPKKFAAKDSGKVISKDGIEVDKVPSNVPLKRLSGNTVEPKTVYIDRHLDQLFQTFAPSVAETKMFIEFFDRTIGVVKKAMLLTTGYILRVLSGDIIHGMIAGIPLGRMLMGWTSGMTEINQISRVHTKVTKIIKEMPKSSDEAVKGLALSDDFLETEKYVFSKLTKKEQDILELGRFYDKEGIINAGQYSQDRAIGGAFTQQDYDAMARNIMIRTGRRLGDPLSKRTMRASFNTANSAINKFIGFGHVSSEASRISVYKHLSRTSGKISKKTGKPLMNWEKLDYSSLNDGLDFALYGNRRLSGAESKYLSRFFPFYRFWRFALEQNIRSVAKGNLKPYYNIQKYFNTIKRAQNIEDEDISNYAIQQNYLPLRVGDDGKIAILKIGYTPATLLNFVDNPQTNAAAEIIGQMNPLIKTLLETATGTNSYTGMEYDNVWEGWASGLIPFYSQAKTHQRIEEKYKKYPDKKRDWMDHFIASFKVTWEGDAAFNRLYETNEGLQEMIAKIVKDGGYVPNLSDLMESYISKVIKKKKY